jgi:hypothetical protein
MDKNKTVKCAECGQGNLVWVDFADRKFHLVDAAITIVRSNTGKLQEPIPERHRCPQ